MDKYRLSKKVKYVSIIISLIALISGSLFINVLKEADINSLNSSIKTFIENTINGNVNYLSSLNSQLLINLGHIIVIWILSLSIIGFPIIIFLYFLKVFSFGLTISGLIKMYSFKGIIYSFFYVFPHNIINIILILYLSIFMVLYSIKIFISFYKKKTINYKEILSLNKHLFLVVLLGIILTSLYNTYIMPYIFKILSKIM